MNDLVNRFSVLLNKVRVSVATGARLEPVHAVIQGLAETGDNLVC
jgi:hypothetical protein